MIVSISNKDEIKIFKNVLHCFVVNLRGTEVELTECNDGNEDINPLDTMGIYEFANRLSIIEAKFSL